MQFEFIAGNLALDFVNTVHRHGATDPGDDLTSIEDLKEWAQQAGILKGRLDSSMYPGFYVARNFRRALVLRDVLYQVFSSISENRAPHFNDLLRLQSIYRNSVRSLVFVRKGRHFELTWPATVPPTERILAEIARAAGDLLTSDALNRVRQCSNPNCSWLFVDTSRAGRRRWCDMKVCGNRAKVYRFRELQNR
jgi:predicted RNA-binding Zn ribbon-like protein